MFPGRDQTKEIQGSCSAGIETMPAAAPYFMYKEKILSHHDMFLPAVNVENT